MVLCPSCQKPVYFAERQLYQGKDYHQICYNILIKQENASRPKTFAIHEQIFCNVEENSKHKYPLAPVDGYYAGIQVSPPSQPSQPSNTTQTSVQSKPKNNLCKKCSGETKPTDKFCTGCGNKL